MNVHLIETKKLRELGTALSKLDFDLYQFCNARDANDLDLCATWGGDANRSFRSLIELLKSDHQFKLMTIMAEPKEGLPFYGQ